MKTLELNQMENVNGGGCLADVGLSWVAGLMVAGPVGGVIGIASALLYSDRCEETNIW